MKYFLIGLFIGFLIVGYIKFQDGRFVINNERTGFFLLKGGYRAWWIRYSSGLTWNVKGDWINLWCLPKFEHCDIRNIPQINKEAR